MYPAVICPWTLGLWLVDGRRCARETERVRFSLRWFTAGDRSRPRRPGRSHTSVAQRKHKKVSVGGEDLRKWPGGHRWLATRRRDVRRSMGSRANLLPTTRRKHTRARFWNPECGIFWNRERRETSQARCQSAIGGGLASRNLYCASTSPNKKKVW
jgi:hypothetical protein